jgi:PatG Domain
MEQPKTNEPLVIASAGGNDALAPVASGGRSAASSLAPRACPSCGAGSATYGGASGTPSYVYAIGRIEARFPRPSVEKEFAQATGRAETAGLSDRQALQKVLSERQNRYLARQLCWVLSVEGLETYLLTHTPGPCRLGPIGGSATRQPQPYGP